MTNQFWIWRDNLPGVLAVLSDMNDFDFDQSNMDEIKYGLIGTSDEKENWFDYQLNNMNLKISFDQADNDIVHIQVVGDLSDQGAKLISIIGTDFVLKTKRKKIE